MPCAISDDGEPCFAVRPETGAADDGERAERDTDAYPVWPVSVEQTQIFFSHVAVASPRMILILIFVFAR